VFSPLWNHNQPLGGTPASATVVMRIAEQVGFFTGLGVVIVALAAVAYGVVTSGPGSLRTRDQLEPDADDEVTEPMMR
jgi:hypothetical protein